MFLFVRFTTKGGEDNLKQLGQKRVIDFSLWGYQDVNALSVSTTVVEIAKICLHAIRRFKRYSRTLSIFSALEVKHFDMFILSFFILQQAMEVGGFEVSKMKFASINIKMKPVSRQARLDFLEKAKRPQFLQSWLSCVLKPKHITLLENANVKEMTFKITIPWVESGNFV